MDVIATDEALVLKVIKTDGATRAPLEGVVFEVFDKDGKVFASGVPQLRARIAAELPQARSVESDLFGSIGAGLAVEAARRYG